MLNYVKILVFSSSPGVVEYKSEIGSKNKVCQHTWFLDGTIQFITLQCLLKLLMFTVVQHWRYSINITIVVWCVNVHHVVTHDPSIYVYGTILCLISFCLLEPYSEFPHLFSYPPSLLSASYSRSTFQKLPVYFSLSVLMYIMRNALAYPPPHLTTPYACVYLWC